MNAEPTAAHEEDPIVTRKVVSRGRNLEVRQLEIADLERIDRFRRAGYGGSVSDALHSLGVDDTVYTVPEVPMETATSPGCRPSPTAAAMLSPVPTATRGRSAGPNPSSAAARSVSRPATAADGHTSGTADAQSIASSTSARRSHR